MKLKHAAWLAGIIEGEGNFRTRPYKRSKEGNGYYSMELNITNTDLKILFRCKELIEKEINKEIAMRPYNDKNKRIRMCYKLTASRKDDLMKILGITRKHMVGRKKEIANRMYSFLKFRSQNMSMNNKRVSQDPQVLQKYMSMYNKLADYMRKINQGIEPVETVHDLS